MTGRSTHLLSCRYGNALVGCLLGWLVWLISSWLVSSWLARAWLTSGFVDWSCWSARPASRLAGGCGLCITLCVTVPAMVV